MKILRNQKGNALILVLVLAELVFVLGGALLFSLSSQALKEKSMERQAIATYLAQAGLEHSIALLEKASGGTPAFPTGAIKIINETNKVHEYEISLTGSEIKSVGRVILSGKLEKEITITATIGADGTITVKRV